MKNFAALLLIASLLPNASFAADAKHENLDKFSEAVKEASPLTLGAMGLYGSIKAAEFKSEDYQEYLAAPESSSSDGLIFGPVQGCSGAEHCIDD